MASEGMLSQALGSDAAQLAAAEKRVLLSRLLARLAHEVRNPLSSLDVHFQLLEEDLASLKSPLKEKAASRLEIIRGELHRLEAKVKHFLRLAHASALELEPVEIPALCEHVCRLLRPEAESHQVELQLLVESDLPPFQADPAQLTQALINLIINALQAVQQNGRVEIHARRGADRTVILEVRDTGPGIAPENLEVIFEPYFTTKADGTGLGLWIAQQIAAAHGGAVTAANGSAGGAILTLRLPIREAPPGAPPDSPRPA